MDPNSFLVLPEQNSAAHGIWNGALFITQMSNLAASLTNSKANPLPLLRSIESSASLRSNDSESMMKNGHGGGGGGGGNESTKSDEDKKLSNQLGHHHGLLGGNMSSVEQIINELVNQYPLVMAASLAGDSDSSSRKANEKKSSTSKLQTSKSNESFSSLPTNSSAAVLYNRLDLSNMNEIIMGILKIKSRNKASLYNLVLPYSTSQTTSNCSSSSSSSSASSTGSDDSQSDSSDSRDTPGSPSSTAGISEYLATTPWLIGYEPNFNNSKSSLASNSTSPNNNSENGASSLTTDGQQQFNSYNETCAPGPDDDSSSNFDGCKR